MTGIALGSDMFVGRVGDQFMMQLGDDGDLALVLTDCVVSAETTGAFTLTFRAEPGGPGAPGQGTYLLEAAGLAPAAVFLVPSRPLPDGGPQYVAVFDDRRPPEPEGRVRP